jgi:hypothetical protein
MMRLATILTLIAWLGVSPSCGQTRETGDFVADPASGCKIWDPHPLAGETASWSGACTNGLAQGPGKVQWSRNGKTVETDEGNWDQGRQSGRGVQDWGSGRYDGEVMSGEPNGHGVMTLQTARYEGEFHSGKPNGQGTVTNLQGVFKGKWKNGCLSDGKQMITFAVPSSSCR